MYSNSSLHFCIKYLNKFESAVSSSIGCWYIVGLAALSLSSKQYHHSQCLSKSFQPNEPYSRWLQCWLDAFRASLSLVYCWVYVVDFFSHSCAEKTVILNTPKCKKNINTIILVKTFVVLGCIHRVRIR